MNHTTTSVLHKSSYDRAACTIGVVHVGLGAFHRAHQAVYFDQLMDQTGDLSWGIAAVNLRAADAPLLENMRNGDGYALKTISTDGTVDYRQIRSHIAFADWSSDTDGAETLLSEPNVKIVTITVTESGYYMLEDGNLDVDHPLIKAEINDGSKDTIYAYLRAGLKRRAIKQAGKITILCCDNLRQNGKLLQRNFREYLAACGDSQLAGWVASNASFPCSMVDRITPRPTPDISTEIATLFARPNDPSVLAEDFIQWIVEDNFVAAKPPLDNVGVQIVDDVDPFEETKIRVLNGGHTGIAYLGALAGYDTFDQAMADPEILGHFTRFENEEVLPALGDNMPLDLDAYLVTITSRFHNTFIADDIARICMDGFAKMGIFILSTVRHCFEIGITPILAIKSIASWYVFAQHEHAGMVKFEYIDPGKSELIPHFADKSGTSFAKSEQLWGDLPNQFPSFVNLLTEQIALLENQYPLTNTNR